MNKAWCQLINYKKGADYALLFKYKDVYTQSNYPVAFINY